MESRKRNRRRKGQEWLNDGDGGAWDREEWSKKKKNSINLLELAYPKTTAKSTSIPKT